MRLYILFCIIGVFVSPIVTELHTLGLTFDENKIGETGASIALLSPYNCSVPYIWNIDNKANETGETKFVTSLVISNLALENGSSLSLYPKATKNLSSKDDSHMLTITGTGVTSLPILYLKANVSYALKYDNPKCSNSTRTLFQASHNNILNDACAPINVTDKYNFESFNYPNNYPLQEYDTNTQCRNVSSSAASIYVTFNDMDLAEGHCLEFADSTKPLNLTDSQIHGDMIVSNKTVISFQRSYNPDANTIRDINSRLSGRGFNITLEALNCGGEILNLESGKITFNVTEGPEKCIWIISTPNNDLKTIKVLNFSLTDGLDNVIIHDSSSRKNNLLVNRTGAEYLNSTTETIIIEYTSSNKTSANLTWSSFVCLDKCLQGRRCINPSELCNGVNDCGDWSDELHCNGSAPIPRPEPAKATGVPGLVVVFVIIPITLILGILGTIFVPRLVARIRGGRYQEFREYSDVS